MFNKDYETDYFSHPDSSLWCLLCVFGRDGGVILKLFFLYGSHLFFKKVVSNFLGGNLRGVQSVVQKLMRLTCM